MFIGSRLEHAPLVRALARQGYAAGARYVDVQYADQHVRRAQIELGPDEMLDHSPQWLVERYEAMAGNAVIGTTGDPEPHLLADLDGAKVGRARMKDVARVAIRQLSERTVNWTGVAYPNEGWAQEVFGEPDVERLWQAVAFCTRLDEPDPVAAWREHMDRLERRATALNALGLDRLTYRGPGTKLELGLLERSRFCSALFHTVDGRPYVANMPTEEVFTTPDARRAEGVVASTKPLALAGEVIEGLRVTFADGRIVDVQAEAAPRSFAASSRATRTRFASAKWRSSTGRRGSVGRARLSSTRSTTRTRRATSRMGAARGRRGMPAGSPSEGINESTVHTDFMIGGPEVDVDGVHVATARTVPLLRDDVCSCPSDRRLASKRYADGIVQVGANVQRDQLVDVIAGPEHATMVREVARAAYRGLASRYVDVRYVDPHLRRALIESPRSTTCPPRMPPWLLSRERTISATSVRPWSR